MSEILNNTYIDRFLFVAFIKYISSQICSHIFETLYLDTLWRLCKLLFFEEKYFKNRLIFIQFYPKTSNLHNLGLVSRKKVPNLSLNNIFSVLSIDLQYTLSFKRPDFGLNCRVTIMPKGQSLTPIRLGGVEAPPGMFCFITFQ